MTRRRMTKRPVWKVCSRKLVVPAPPVPRFALLLSEDLSAILEGSKQLLNSVKRWETNVVSILSNNVIYHVSVYSVIVSYRRSTLIRYQKNFITYMTKNTEVYLTFLLVFKLTQKNLCLIWKQFMPLKYLVFITLHVRNFYYNWHDIIET